MSVNKIQDPVQQYLITKATRQAATEPIQGTKEELAEARQENRDVVDFKTLWEETRAKEQEMLRQMQAAAEKARIKMKVSPPSDSSGKLTRRLVSANMPMEVRGVMMEASRAISNLQIAAANCDKADRAKIDAMIARIRKVLDRGSRKIKDMDSEQQLAARRKKAQKAKQNTRADDLKEQLRRRVTERKFREQRYLWEANCNQVFDAIQQARDGLDPASEAQIEAYAEAMAAAEVAAGGGDVAMGGEMAMEGGAVAVGDAGGGGEAVAISVE